MSHVVLSGTNIYFLCFAKAIAVSRDHKPDQSDERQRIEDAGGFVMWAGKKTFNGNLSSYICLYHLFNQIYSKRNMESWGSSCCFSCIWR